MENQVHSTMKEKHEINWFMEIFRKFTNPIMGMDMCTENTYSISNWFGVTILAIGKIVLMYTGNNSFGTYWKQTSN